ncbi:MAG: hypothetical protein VXY11_05000 [Candidatus Thermoplasmatota archaeon]|nr:hypothetical protein [Candidatus Thermoplasmatota archaeon]
MNWKKPAAAAAITVVVAAAVWTYLVATYESELGTSNVIMVDSENSVSDYREDNPLVELNFDDGAEDLSWSSLEINLVIEDTTYGCSFGAQSNSTSLSGKVNPKLGADGFTFTTEIDATDSESYTHFDLPGQLESNSTDYWMKFSSTDIYLSEGISWTFIEGAELSEVNEVPVDLSNETSERLEWYTYDMSVHRVNPNNGVYVFAKDELAFKVNFLTYYNEQDENRYPTLQIAAIGESNFPALNDPDLVVPSPCKIVSDDIDEGHWNSNETIQLFENQINLCDGTCSIEILVYYETVEVEVDERELLIG